MAGVHTDKPKASLLFPLLHPFSFSSLKSQHTYLRMSSSIRESHPNKPNFCLFSSFQTHPNNYHPSFVCFSSFSTCCKSPYYSSFHNPIEYYHRDTSKAFGVNILHGRGNIFLLHEFLVIVAIQVNKEKRI